MNYYLILGIILVVAFLFLGGADIFRNAVGEVKKFKDSLTGKTKSDTDKRAEKIESGMSQSG